MPADTFASLGRTPPNPPESGFIDILQDANYHDQIVKEQNKPTMQSHRRPATLSAGNPRNPRIGRGTKPFAGPAMDRGSFRSPGAGLNPRHRSLATQLQPVHRTCFAIREPKCRIQSIGWLIHEN